MSLLTNVKSIEAVVRLPAKLQAVVKPVEIKYIRGKSPSAASAALPSLSVTKQDLEELKLAMFNLAGIQANEIAFKYFVHWGAVIAPNYAIKITAQEAGYFAQDIPLPDEIAGKLGLLRYQRSSQLGRDGKPYWHTLVDNSSLPTFLGRYSLGYLDVGEIVLLEVYVKPPDVPEYREI